MKKIFFFFLLLIPSSLFACDICNFYIGLSPDDFNNSIGMQYRSRFLNGSFASENGAQNRHASHILNEDATKGKEIFNVAELRFRYYHGKQKRWNSIFSLPLVNNYRSINGFTQTDVYGTGDPLVISQYLVFSSKKEKNYMHRLSAGAGVKLPLGSRNLHYRSQTADLDMQGSTGSVDVLLRAEYIGLANGLGMMHQFSYKINSKGSYAYRYGNTLNYTLLFFYRHQINPKKTLSPNMGFLLEQAAEDHENGVLVKDSGGKVWMWNIGLDFYSGRVQLQMNYQPALSNAFNGKQLPVVNRFIMGIQFSL